MKSGSFPGIRPSFRSIDQDNLIIIVTGLQGITSAMCPFNRRTVQEDSHLTSKSASFVFGLLTTSVMGSASINKCGAHTQCP